MMDKEGMCQRIVVVDDDNYFNDFIKLFKQK